MHYREKIFQNAFDLAAFIFVTGILMGVIRGYEAVVLQSQLFDGYAPFSLLYLTFFNDLKFTVAFSMIVLPFILLRKGARTIFMIYFSLLLLLSGVLTKHFLVNFYLMGAEVCYFTFDEIRFILESEGGSFSIGDIFLFLPTIIFMLYIWYAYRHHASWVHRIAKYAAVAIYIVFVTIVVIDFNYLFPRYSNFSNHQQYTLVHHKLSFFVFDVYESQQQTPPLTYSDVAEDIDDYQKATSYFSYTNAKYPLLHNTPYSNALGDYFQKDSLKPNIVFIMVESLSRSFSGPSADLGNFTPFIDSLRMHSLYWENFLSNAERTYGILPNTLSSAPFFDNFMVAKPYVKHQSIISELNKYHYSSHFLYGGWANFSSMEDYLKYQNITNIFDDKTFSEKVAGEKKNVKDDFDWGYNDEELLKNYFLHHQTFTEPYLSVILTISMHTPFDVGTDYTPEDAKKYLGQMSEEEQQLFSAHEEKVTAITFTDENLKLFFKEYEKRPDFDHTIFFIYGDHANHSLPLKNKMATFHVPLLMYSKLLTDSDSFKGVSTHRDIVPSIMGLLEGNFGMEFNVSKHWLGSGLDTSHTLRCTKITPMVLGSKEHISFMNKDNVVIDNTTFVMDSTMNLSIERNEEKKQKTLQLYHQYSNIEHYIYNMNRLYVEKN